MKTHRWYAALAASFAIGFATLPARAFEIAEVRGDFYYDAQGTFVGMRHKDLPEGFERRPMSAKEKFEILGVQLPERPTYLEPRQAFEKPAQVVGHEKLSSDIVIVKFVDGMSVRLRNGALKVDGAALSGIDAIAARYADAKIERVFTAAERILEENKESGERITGKELADLNNFYLFKFDTPSQRGVDLANELNKLDYVELAYLQAKGEAPVCTDVAPASPNFVANQNYLTAAPNGIDANYAWSYHAGGNGAGPGFWVCDLEWDWCISHEDMNLNASDVINGLSGGSDPDHGTAVLGEIASCNNSYGTTGISHDVTLKMSDFDSATSWANNISTADAFLIPGEVMLLEIHIWGGPSGEVCVCNCSQFEYVPVEWDPASFTAIQTATANGQVVVEAAGNGSMNLDHARYGGWFNPVTHNSGAIMVGAGTNSGHAPECWTDYGSRVDVHGYGDSVYTTGYGWAFDQPGCNQDYMNGFSGTSSASPIITGAAACLQGIANAKYGIDLSAAQIRTALVYGGTPQAAPLSKNIGPMPNLVNSIKWIEPDVVPYHVPAGWTYSTVPRSTADSNAGSVPLQAGALPGNAAGTYWNWTEQNASYSYTSTVSSPHAGLFVDDSYLWFCFNPNMAPGAWSWCGNIGPDFIKGGRHTVLNRSDVDGVESEWSEANDWARQYIWSPLALATNAPTVRSYDPPRTSTGWGPYYNSEGFSAATGGSFWYAFAVSPSDASSDFDIYLNTEAPSNIPQAGFGAAVASSGAGGDVTDFVILDRNTVAGGTYYASGINWSGFANKVVEFDGDKGVINNPGVTGSYTLNGGELVNLHEVFLVAGVPTRIQVEWLSGNANYGVSLHNTASGFDSKWGATGFSDNVGPTGSEYILVTAPANDFYGISVWKSASADVGQFLTYNVVVSQVPNLTDATPIGWFGPIVPRTSLDATPTFAPLPATLPGNSATISFNFNTLNQGPGTVFSPWFTRLFLDDVNTWIGNAPASLAQSTLYPWMNTSVGSPASSVRGGRHHLRTFSDSDAQVAELPETDNNFTDWFAFTGLPLTNGVPVVRSAPPVQAPLGFGPEWSCDGFATPLFLSYWSAVGVLPSSLTSDYDVRTHNAYVGSRDGFGSIIDWSGDATDGNVDFALVNYNVAGAVPDFSVLNWNSATSTCAVERAEATTLITANPGITTVGPFSEGANGVLNSFELLVPPASVGLPVYISLAIDSGTANMGLKLFDGTFPNHNVFTAMAESNSGGPGVDEHLPAQFFGASGFHGIVVHKTNATDLPLGATYRLVISVGGSATDAPSVDAIPNAFALTAPRPNPFTGETALRFDVPANGGSATVAVFDLQGRRVTTLAEGSQAPGRHILTWKGTDEGGRKVAAGVYFVRLQSATAEETRKITVLK